MSLEETHWDCFEFSLWINLPPDEVLDITGVSTSPSPTTPSQALVTYLNVSSPEVMLQVETGFSDKNTWLEWITFMLSTNMTECIACSSARPQLFTTPALPHGVSQSCSQWV
ncbi:hypothetical protein ILYODFUR_029110 [Ilyodon furcidens]|uniref:Uncharacterized protein n=1 Tax=Ilyodon furcidens TaxID=33524 RepID=A0ABV0UJY2_9TELE